MKYKKLLQPLISLSLCLVLLAGSFVFGQTTHAEEGLTYVYKIMFVKQYSSEPDINIDTIVRETASLDAPFGAFTAEVPEKEGYIFCGWAAEEGDGARRISYAPITAPDGTTTMVADESWSFRDYMKYSGVSDVHYDYTAILRLKPVWVKENAKHYTITFFANGGVSEPEPMDKVEGLNKILRVDAPTREGYEFIGWGLTRDARVSRYESGQSIEVNENTKLYALWKRTVSIMYDANGGVGAPNGQTETIYNDATAPYFAISRITPTREGYKFKGWARTKDAATPEYQAARSYKIADSCTLYAVWEKEQVIVPPVDPIDQVDPVDPIDPVDPVDPVNPIDPVDPVEPVKPEKTDCKITASPLTIAIDSKGGYLDYEVNSDGKKTFKSSAKEVATVDASGKIVPKKIGSTKITITVAETDQYKKGTATVTVTVGPKKVTISKVTSPKKAYMKVTWKKNTTATGYQIAYSTDKTFAKGTKNVSITKQKTVSKSIKVTSKKTYYVRMRSYKTVSGKKYYGPWSSVKSVKIK